MNKLQSQAEYELSEGDQAFIEAIKHSNAPSNAAMLMAELSVKLDEANTSVKADRRRALAEAHELLEQLPGTYPKPVKRVEVDADAAAE